MIDKKNKRQRGQVLVCHIQQRGRYPLFVIRIKSQKHPHVFRCDKTLPFRKNPGSGLTFQQFPKSGGRFINDEPPPPASPKGRKAIAATKGTLPFSPLLFPLLLDNRSERVLM